jgi:hypothetical protein
MTNTERTVALLAAVRPSAADLVGGQHVVELGDLRSLSAIIGYLTVAPCVSSMSFDQALWRSTGSADRPISLAFRLGELGLDLRHVAELGRAHRGEVFRMREEIAHLYADPVVERIFP